MPDDIDLKQLAVDREDSTTTSIKPQRSYLSRYMVPGLLVLGFVAIIVWALRDVLMPGTPVTVIPVHVSQVQNQQQGTPLFKAAGWVEPRPTVIRVAALAEGVVRELLVVDDQAVKQGDPVVMMVEDDARLELEAARAQVALSMARLEEARANLVAATTNFEKPLQLQVELAAAEAQLAGVATELTNLPFQLQRAAARLRFAQQDLAGKTRAGTVVAGVAVDEAESELESAKALVMELEKRDGSLMAEAVALKRKRVAVEEKLELKTEEQRQLDKAVAALAASQASLDQDLVAEAEAELRLSRMVVRAPVDGRVLQLRAGPGTHLSGGIGRQGEHDGGVAVTLYQPSMLQVRVDVRFEDLPRGQVDQEVMIESAAMSSAMVGRVLYLSSEADIQKNTLEVKVAIETPADVIKPEMLVDATFLAGKREGGVAPAGSVSIYVPRLHLREDEQGTYVWTVDAEGDRAERSRVETAGPAGGSLVQIISGLSPSSRIIVSPPEGLDDGDRVKVTGEQPPAE
ncbi:MAG: HlyD family efflux transporter periplasmic adaptor subunit [Pirellulaceae bacterium]